ncbi:AAA family ATPase [Endozoicomonas sp. ALB032]|uniref:AAA family ATPase n=1 Tax=Endozoicomonas sp. ALB032 TaxID=3403082 RepID=UPI003BB6CAFF
MDGQIDGGTKKHALDPNLLDHGGHGVAAKIAKLDLLSEQEKTVRSCSEVRSKLNRSPFLETVPDKVRTVSSTDSSLPKATHSFDFRFVASDDEVRQLLTAITCNEDVTVISHPDDLSQANLVSRLSISEEGRHTLRSGKLFEGSQPFTLMIDIRQLTSEELPKFNDLLNPDTPCLYDKISQKKRPLGGHVSLLVLAAPEQLRSVGRLDGAPAVGAPGADFWRRINRPGNTWQFKAQTGNDPSMDIDKVPPVLTELPSAESAMEDDNTVLIDCHLHGHWRQLLLGGPGVDQEGRIRHIPGRLECLKAGQRVILKGANCRDLAFEQTIRQMLAKKCFESNGKICPLPDDVQFYQMPVGDDELHSLFQSLSHSLTREGVKEDDNRENASGSPIIINQSNIAQWLNPIAIAPEGYAVPNTCLLEQVREGGVVTVTSPLAEALWFRLLGSLATIRATTGLEPRLQVAHWKQQPEALGLTETDERPLFGSHQQQKKIKDHDAFEAVTYGQHAEASQWINDHRGAPLVIRVNEQTCLSQLFDNLYITSEQKAYFERCQSELQKALIAGKPVAFLGLERNPSLAQLLEPLMMGQPLLINGQLQAYPRAHVTLLWPESAISPSPVFRSLVAAGKPCPEVDLWDINAHKHGISRTELPEQALKQLYQAFETVPCGLCNPLPEMTKGLLNNLILAAQRAQQVDHASQLLPRHWRKAIDSVVTHGTRQHQSVRDFMKVACWQLLPDKMPDADEKPDKDQTASVDPDRLNAIINSALPLNRVFVEQNLWSLARAFDPAVFKGNELRLSYKSPFPEWSEADVLDRLSAIILAHVPEHQRDAIAYQLEISPAAAKPWQSLAIRPARQIKRLQDALACGWHLPLLPGQTRSDAIHALAIDCFHIARGEYVTESPAERIERIENRLSDSLQPGFAYRPLSALAQDLYHGEMSQEDREIRRLSRLHDRLTDSPVLFLEGETGTGKSYFSAKMAKASGQAAVISLGPSDSEQTLMKHWYWKKYADGDRSMAQQNRALMEWANTPSDKDGHYVTLVLDEANLAKAGLLASLNGLWEPEPCIYIDGQPVKVGPKHRVILTGNPNHYAGRQLDPALKEKLSRAYYPRLDQAFLRDRVVEPALVRQLQRHLQDYDQINKIAHEATESVMALWRYYQELLPEHEFTPRDLTDICSWVGWYLDRGLSKGDSVSCKQVNSLIRQSFRDVLGPEITETHQDALLALEIWFAARYQLDNTLNDKVRTQNLNDIQQPFMEYTDKNRPEFDTSGSAVIELAQQLGQDLSRCQQAYHRKIKHDGRQATLIEGPAGRGKDATLNLVIESAKQRARLRQEPMPEVHLLNACDCSWEQLCEVIQKAKLEGGIVVISEMNLIDSQHLEGELNDILAGDAHPGFHLFATINPPEYSGRKPLSPALKGRFRHLPIRQYNPAELQTIAGKVLPESSEGTSAAKKLTEKHCLLRAHLQGRKLPLQPTSLDLQNVARAVLAGGDFSEKAVHQCLNQHYRLYLMAADISLEKLHESPALAMEKSEFSSGLCRWFNQTVSGISRPWLIRKSDCNSIDEKNHEIRIKTQLTPEEAKTEIIKGIAQAKWQASGLSLKPDESDDILTRALYRHWQQCWFDRQFGQSGVDASSLFPLTEEESQTLKLSINQPYLQTADQRIEAWEAGEVQWWPAFWRQISGLLNHLVDDFINETPAVSAYKAPEQNLPKIQEQQASALDQRTNREPQPVNEVSTISSDKAPEQNMPKVQEQQAPALDQRTNHEPQPVNKTLAASADKTPEKYLPEAHLEKAPKLDRKTNYENQERPTVKEYKIFDTTQFPSAMMRLWAEDVYVSPEGNVKQISINDQHIQGAEVLVPARLPEPDQEVILARDQTLATFTWPSKNGQLELPSLTTKDYIVALRMKPGFSYTLLRDRYTGLHTLFIPEAKDNQNIELAYIVESRKAGKKTPVEEVRPAQSTRFDTRCSEGMRSVLKEVFDNIKGQPTEVQIPLQNIKDAKNTRQRIMAIRDYCKQFSGKAEPKKTENYFHFLVTQRQGRCRHRVPVFVALCRYFGIPCRKIRSYTHAFAEFSADRGQTWESADLGGAPTRDINILSKFQPRKQVRGSGTQSKKIKDILKGADLAQKAALAQAIGLSPEELSKALEQDTTLPVSQLDTLEVLKELWRRKDLASFSLGVAMIESLDTKELSDVKHELLSSETHPNRKNGFPDSKPWFDYDDKSLINSLWTGHENLPPSHIIRGDRHNPKPVSEAVKELLIFRHEDQVTEPLKSLHSKLIVQAGVSPQKWLSAIVDILKFPCINSSTIRLAHEALTLGWLDPLPTDMVGAHEHHDLLVRLQKIDALKVKATRCLKKWYQEFLSREKNNQVWQLAYKDFLEREGDVMFVEHRHGGFSRLLEENIASQSVKSAWTEQPEGVPDIERMLAQQPAFSKFISGQTNHRPVIILGQPSWKDSVSNEKIKALFQLKIKNTPDLKQVLERINKNHANRDQCANNVRALNKAFREAGGNTQSQAQKEEYEKKRNELLNNYTLSLETLNSSLKDEELLNHLKDKCKKAVQQAFCHYLYGVTHSKGSSLMYCWAEARIGSETQESDNYGTHAPSSPKELYAMMSEIDSSRECEHRFKDAYLRQALNVSNALVLKPGKLEAIAKEFLSSVNLISLYESLET